jgi:AcrR family transcriptional regulator
MDQGVAQTQLLDAAEELFYGRGIQSVGMDDIRSASGLSLKRVYQLFPAKEQIVTAYLDRRDARWRGRLADHVSATGTDPRERILAVFDWLGEWFAEPNFRGCAWINCYGELGAVSEQVAELARTHKSAFRAYLGTLVAAAGLPEATAEHLYLLAEGAMVTAGIFGTPESAVHARAAASLLISRPASG